MKDLLVVLRGINASRSCWVVGFEDGNDISRKCFCIAAVKNRARMSGYACVQRSVMQSIITFAQEIFHNFKWISENLYLFTLVACKIETRIVFSLAVIALAVFLKCVQSITH